MGVSMKFTDLDQYLFGQGTNYEVYKKLGAHPTTYRRKKGVYFAVWAPNAQSVSVIGEFNDWEEEANPMEKVGPIGVYEVFVPGAKIGQLYKFFIVGAHGEKLYKADPYANEAELRPGTASRITDITDYKWKDATWIKNREKFDEQVEPMAIYEVHPGSWKKHPQSEENEKGFYNYREFAHALAAYVKEMGYTHVELMGIAEHPFDGSWGYQVTGYYAPTSRYGTPQDFKYMVDYLHQNKIGVILDWVPAHFPKDAHGLVNFDGTAVYEHADPRQGEHPDWGTKIYNYGRPEVKNFLIANALYWVEECHVDGLRVDAVASMLYLDYGKKDGEWIANKYGGNQNLEAIEFFKHLNTVVLGRNHGTVMIAEESTAWPMVTGDAEKDGLGFSLKWNMGWMNDFLEYMMLYLDYGRKDGEWVANKYGENKNLEAIDFFRHLNSVVLGRNPGALMIAEESTAWPQVTGDVEEGGLGFSLKWNMGWMHDFTEYMKLDPYFRKFNHGKLTFSLMYAYSENFILVLSHDEVVHLKCSMLGKMPGDKDDKFSNLKLAYAYMCGHPGKKLLFMGQEFGQWNEWSEERELDWYLLDDESHKQMKDFTKKCMLLYKNYRCLYETDYRPEGFRWINANDKDNSVYSFIRISPDNNKHLLFVLSFTPVERNKFRIGAPLKGKYKLVLGSNEDIQKKTLTAVKGDCDGYKQSLLIDLPAYGIAVYEFSGDLGIDD